MCISVKLELFEDINNMGIQDIKNILGDRFFEILNEAASSVKSAHD